MNGISTSAGSLLLDKLNLANQNVSVTFILPFLSIALSTICGVLDRLSE